MGTKIILVVLSISALLTGCDLGIQPDNEFIEAVITAYEEKFDQEVSQDMHDCMRKFEKSYVDKMEPCWGTTGSMEGVNGLTCVNPGRHYIQILKSTSPGITEQIEDINTTHEYIHTLLICLGQESGGNAHVDPNFWTCTDSIENMTAKMYGGTARNRVYTTKCKVGTEPVNYHPYK